MLDHVAHFIGPGLIPRILDVAGVDEQDVALFNFDAVGNVLRGVDAIVLGDVAQVYHHAGADEVGQGDGGNVAPVRAKV